MGSDLRFDGRVVVITGAGAGLGRAHALLFASRGAKVVVNDLGGAMSGGGASSAAADQVVAEIRAAGGEAVASYDSVEEGAKIVQCALDHFKKIDVVVNNAGILRDSSFRKMTDEDWELIYRVHVRGSYQVTHAAWPHLLDAGYGRVIFTVSAAGIYGNFGQANYSMAKLGLLGLSNALAIEGAKKNVRVNAVAPVAGSRLTETVLTKEMLDALRPEQVSPLVAWLCHESCDATGGLYEVGGGAFMKLRWQRAKGKSFKLGRTITPEAVQASWEAIGDFSEATHPASVAESLEPIVANMGTTSRGGNEFIDVDEALGKELPPTTSRYTERDLTLYALGVGAGRDPLDAADLKLVYERNPDGFHALPTFAVVQALSGLLQMVMEGRQMPGVSFGLDRLLHGEQYFEVMRPLPAEASLRHRSRIKDIFDKGKNALLTYAVDSEDAATGELLARNEFNFIIRGAGGWGGERGPSGETNVPPERAPDAVVTEKISENQALLYRLSGDWNPLHADPSFAQAFGFPRPILHGLCTFGYVGRHVIKAFAGGDPRYFKSIRCRFAASVFPGDTLRTEMWKEEGRVVLRCKVVERDELVLSHTAVELYAEIPQPKAVAAPAAAAAPAAEAGGLATADVFAAIRDYVERNPELVQKVNQVFTFKIKSPDSAWTLDLKAGKVLEGAAEKPDVTLEMLESDWLAMSTDKADAQKLYFGGKLKITGNVMASQKLGFLKKIDLSRPRAESRPAVVAAAAPAAAQAALIFSLLAERLAQTPALAAEVGALVQFRVLDPEAAWVVDLRTSPGAVREGTEAGPAATLTLSDESLVALVRGTRSAQDLFMRGDLRADGDVTVARRLGFLKQLI